MGTAALFVVITWLTPCRLSLFARLIHHIRHGTGIPIALSLWLYLSPYLSLSSPSSQCDSQNCLGDLRQGQYQCHTTEISKECRGYLWDDLSGTVLAGIDAKDCWKAGDIDGPPHRTHLRIVGAVCGGNVRQPTDLHWSDSGPSQTCPRNAPHRY